MSVPFLALFSGFYVPWRKDQNPQQGPQPSLFSLLFLLPSGHEPCRLLLVSAVLCVLLRWCLEHAGPLSEAPSTYSHSFIISWLTSDNLLHLGSDIKQDFSLLPTLDQTFLYMLSDAAYFSFCSLAFFVIIYMCKYLIPVDHLHETMCSKKPSFGERVVIFIPSTL